MRACYQDYVCSNIKAQDVSRKHGVDHAAMLRWFRRLGLQLRPTGFRMGNSKGSSTGDTARARYLWFFKHGYKRRAARKGLVVTITDDQFIALVTSPCFYCGKPHTEETRKVHKERIHMLTVDRKDSDQGYTLDNCVSCCKVCNTSKMDLGFELWVDHMKKILTNLGKL